MEQKKKQTEQKGGSPSPHANHRKRVRAGFLQHGIDGMADHQVLELLLFYAIPRADTNVLAHQLLNAFGSLPAVFDAPIEALTEVPGIGAETAILLKLLPAVWNRCRECDARAAEIIGTRADLERVLVPLFTHPQLEQFACVLTDACGRILKRFVVDTGNVRSVFADGDMIVREALLNHASYAAVAHSHPGGFAAPSLDDLNGTTALAQQLQKVDVGLMDHLISAKDGVYFLSDCAKLPEEILLFSKKRVCPF